MIKIGVFGLSGETIDLAREIRQKTEKAELLFFTHDLRPDSAAHPHSYFSFTDPDNLVSRSEKLIFTHPSSEDMPFIKQALRQSKPLFFIRTGNLTLDNMEEIVCLSGEAEVPAVCYNPVWTRFIPGKIPAVISNPLYAETIYRVPISQFSTEDILQDLSFSLESMLRIFRAFPKRPVVNVYSASLIRTDMIYVRLDFDNSAMALFKYEGLSKVREHSCRITQTGFLIHCDFINGEVRHLLIKPEELSVTRSIMLTGENHSLYRSWQFFLPGGKENNIFMEDRLATLRIRQFIEDKIRHHSFAPQKAVKNLQ